MRTLRAIKMARKPRKDAKGGGSTNASTETNVRESSTSSISRPRRQTWRLLFDVRTRRAFYLILLAALYAPLSQLILSPVYGSIPSAIYHRYGIIASNMLAFGIKDNLPARVNSFFAPFVFWIPLIHFVLFSFSTVLGNPLGPFITECLTLYPLITISMCLATKQFESMDLPFLNETFTEAGPPMLNYFFFTVFERILRGILPTWMGMNILFTRVGLQMIVGATYTSIIPHSFLWPSLPAIAFTAVGNTHAPLLKTTEILNNTLHLSDYSLIARHESLTGYISVLQDNKNNFRAMRCDHSLLGGEWILPPNDKRKVAEPVYAVFTMLESVRLVEREKPKEQERALNIGLGVGTVPSALISHGINTTIIELDLAVYQFAMNYFNLPKNHTAFIGDAMSVVETKKKTQQEHYDYIIHDVFTGGAEPAPLFATEFLSGLNDMLKADGVIAINYAGDLSMPSTSLIYRTILEIFPSCRVFREDDQVGEDGKAMVDGQGEFTNMVFICNKGSKPVKFRKAVDADFLGSASRKAYMVPKHEVSASKFEREGDILTSRNLRILEKMQVKSAIGHWKLMRTIIPAAVWENW